MRNRFLRGAGLTLGVLLCVSSGVRADNWKTTYTDPGGVGVNVVRTDPSPPATGTISEGTIAVPFTMVDTTAGANFGSTFVGFCIDLYHNVSNNQVTTNNPGFVNVAGATGAGAGNAGTTASPFPNYSAYTSTGDFGSRLNYLGGLFGALTTAYGSDKYVMGAVQLAVWALLDNKFVASGEASQMATDFTKIMSMIGSAPSGNGTGVTAYTFATASGSSNTVTYAGYSTVGDYTGAGGQVLRVHTNANDGGSIQNVITWGNGFTPQAITPEPSTLAIAGLGALGFLGYGWRRRKSF